MIDRSGKLSISTQAMVLDISRGSVYYLSQGVSEAQMALMLKIEDLHLDTPPWVHASWCVSCAGWALRWADCTCARSRCAWGSGHGPAARQLQARTGPQVLPVLAAPRCHHPGQPGPGAGHDLHPPRHGFVYLTAIVYVVTRWVMVIKVATTLGRVTPKKSCKKRCSNTALLRLSTPTKEVSSRRKSLPTWCLIAGPGCPWTDAAPGARIWGFATTCLSSGCGAA